MYCNGAEPENRRLATPSTAPTLFPSSVGIALPPMSPGVQVPGPQVSRSPGTKYPTPCSSPNTCSKDINIDPYFYKKSKIFCKFRPIKTVKHAYLKFVIDFKRYIPSYVPKTK